MMLMLLAALTVVARGTVVMVHGAGGGGWEYDKWAPVFQRRGWKVVHRDLLPVHGGYQATNFQDYVEQVLRWTPRQGRVVYIGASMGGVLALKANEKRPADAVVLVNSVPPAGVGERASQELSPPVVRWANGPLKDTEDSMPDSDRATILWAWKRWRDESGSVMNAIRAGIPAKKPTCPVLVVLGEFDQDVPQANGLSLASWANAEIRSYPSMSHVGPLMSTRAEKVANDVVDWLGDKLPHSR